MQLMAQIKSLGNRKNSNNGCDCDVFLIIWESLGLFWTAESNVVLNMCTHIQRSPPLPGQQGQVWKNAASKALYLHYKAQGDIASNAPLSTAVAYL